MPNYEISKIIPPEEPTKLSFPGEAISIVEYLDQISDLGIAQLHAIVVSATQQQTLITYSNLSQFINKINYNESDLAAIEAIYATADEIIRSTTEEDTEISLLYQQFQVIVSSQFSQYVIQRNAAHTYVQ